MAGWLSRNANASMAHRAVGMPMTGMHPRTNPSASVNARRGGEIPCRSQIAAFCLIVSRVSTGGCIVPTLPCEMQREDELVKTLVRGLNRAASNQSSVGEVERETPVAQLRHDPLHLPIEGTCA